MADQVMNETSAEMVRAWRVAMAVGRFMAMRRHQALRKAEQSSLQHERALRRAIEDERLLAQKVYAQALDDKWWNSAVQDLSLIHISEPTRRTERSRMPSSA